MSVIGRGSIAQVQYSGDEAVAEIKKLLDAVVDDEDSFDTWEPLVIRAADLEGGVNRNSSPSSIELVRNVFDCFLAKFPLFFGYWKKYADLEFAIGGTETAEMVYERGVSCIAFSVDLWVNYLSFKMDTCHDSDAIRELFERGAIFVGQDYQGHPFWDKYIEFEERINNYGNIFKIHERLTHIPLYHVDKYYQKFRTYIASRPLLEMADEETLKMFEDEVKRENPEPKAELELDRLLRVKIDAHYYGINQLTSTETHKRWKYESQIKRAYFHVTPIEEAELSNWREYLDFEEAEGDVDRTRLLYERCLISCALYDEFWLRYARWLYSKACAEEIEHDEKSRIHPEVQRQIYEEDARITYMRAGCIFVPIGQPTIRLHWARFEEKLERIPVARDIHLAILMEIPEHVETIISLAGLERRHEGYEAALQLLELYVDQHGEGVSGQLTAEQARIMWQCGGEANRARKLFHDRHERYLFSRDFWSAYLDFEMSQPFTAEEQSHDRAKLVHQLMREKAQFHSSAVMALSHKYMAFLLNRGGKEAAHEYMQLDKEVNRYVSASPSPENPPQ